MFHNTIPTSRNVALQKFFQWLKNNGLEVEKTKVRYTPCEIGGFGMRAAQDVCKGDVLCNIPIRLIIGYRHSIPANSPLGNIVDYLQEHQDTFVLNSMLIPILVLLHEKYNRETSFWGPYIDILPGSDSMSSTLYFSDEELDELKGSIKTIELHNISICVVDYLMSNIDDLRSTFPTIISAEMYNRELVKWSVAILWSRGWQVSENENSNWCLAPYADLFNHSFAGGTSWR
eukprot:TRINITY_DN3787_c0_g1_i4.p1 TRINITY_DN3787_c0_g1~~TRINITY_DN3787_c0_g1_i4.p1  ORF type:complete len:231 (-),score=20.27 TRINITY_DN3787_c0_g1_i4:705-1397(-)